MAVPPRQHAVSHLQARYQRAPPAPLPLPADEPCRPWLCPVGALAGQYLTAELEEVQKADFARKMSSIMGKGTVDARALDPRPVVRARLFTCDPNGGNRVEIEPDPDTKELTAFNGQLICKAGLYPYNRDYERDGDLTRFAGGRVTPSPLLPSSAQPQAELASEFAYPPATLARAPVRPLAPHCEMAYALSGMRDLRARECQAYHEPVGKVALYFVFEDLRVSEVGHFVLKYSLIFLDNAFVARPDIKPPVLAKCWGGVFAIYPSKKAPPKEKSTDFGMFLYTNNLLSRPHTEKPANKRKAAQAEKEKEREKAAAHSLAHPSNPAHPQHPAQSSSIFHPFPPPSGLGAGPSIAMDPFQGQQQGGSRQPQPPSYTFPFPPGAFPHAPGRDEGPLPRITVDSIRRAEAGGSGARREEELSPRREEASPVRREEVSPRAREQAARASVQEVRASVQDVRARGQPESSVRGRGYTDEPMRDDFVDERERYSPRRRQDNDSPRRRQDDNSPRRRQERDDNSPRRRSASPRRSPPRPNGQRVPTPPRRASPPPPRTSQHAPTPDEPLPRPSTLPTANANASRTSTDRASTSTDRASTSTAAPTSSTSNATSHPAPSAPTPTASLARTAGTKPAAVSAAELRAQELEGIALAQARHEAWLRAQYDPPPAPAPVDIPPDVLAAAAALADDGGSEGSGPSGGAVEELGEGKDAGVLRVVARERERDEERVVERRRLKFDPVRDS